MAFTVACGNRLDRRPRPVDRPGRRCGGVGLGHQTEELTRGKAGMSLESMILASEQTAPCPACTYPVWFRMVEVVAQVTITCPACRTAIRLGEDRASVRTSIAEVESAFADLERTLKGMFG